MGLDLLALLGILGGVDLGLLDHLVDLALVERGRARDGDLLLLAGGPVLGVDVDDAVGVDVEGDFHLGHATWRRRDAVQRELAQLLVVLGQRPFALQHDNLHARLVVGRRREGLRLTGWDGGIARDHHGVDCALGHDAEAERRDVEQEHVLDVALQHARLDGGAHGHDLVGVDPPMGILAGEALDQLLDHRHPGRAADQDDLVNVRRLQAGVFQGRLEGALAAGRQIVGQLLELGAGELHVEVLRSRGVSGHKGQVDVGLLPRTELDLGLLGSLGEPLERLTIGAQVDALVLLELVGDPVDDAAIVVVAAEMGVAIGGLDLEDALANLQHGNVEGAAPEVEDEDLLVGLLVQAVGQRGRGGLVDDPDNVEAGDLAGVLGGLALRVVEVRRDGDHGVLDGGAQVGFGVGLELLEHDRRDLLRREPLTRDLDLSPVVLAGHDLIGHDLALGVDLREATAHEALDGVDGVLGIDGRLAPGQRTNEALAALGECHHRRRCPTSF